MAQTTNYVTTGIIRDKAAIDTENQHKEQALRAYKKLKMEFDQSVSALGLSLEDMEKLDYESKGVVPPPSVVGETGPDETKRSAEELRNHPEDNPTQTLEAKNAAVKGAKEHEAKGKKDSQADSEASASESINEKHKALAEEQDAERKHKAHSHKKEK